MSRSTPPASPIDALFHPVCFVLFLVVGGLASPAKAQTSHDPSDWYGAQVVVMGSSASGGWEHTAVSHSMGGEGWSASGSAEMEFGTLKAVATTGARGPNNCHPWFCSYRATSVASAWDIITLTNDTEEVQYVPFEFTADGSASNGDWGYASGFARYSFGSDATTWFSAPKVDITHAPLSVSQTLRLDPGQTLTRYWFAAIGAEASRGGTADFGHTMRFTWEVPDGVSYTSASGSFMNGVPSAVPEPATWAMMIVGVGLVGATLRRRGLAAA
jgi:hypothetical protein